MVGLLQAMLPRNAHQGYSCVAVEVSAFDIYIKIRKRKENQSSKHV